MKLYGQIALPLSQYPFSSRLVFFVDNTRLFIMIDPLGNSWLVETAVAWCLWNIFDITQSDRIVFSMPSCVVAWIMTWPYLYILVGSRGVKVSKRLRSLQMWNGSRQGGGVLLSRKKLALIFFVCLLCGLFPYENFTLIGRLGVFFLVGHSGSLPVFVCGVGDG